MNERNEKELSDQEIYELYKRDRKAAWDAAIRKCQPKVKSVIRRYFSNYNKPLDDMYQSGAVGIMKALNSFNPEKGELKNYCINFIKKECRAQLIFDCNESSEYYYELHITVDRARTELEARGMNPSKENIMKLTGLSEKVVEREMGVDYASASFELLYDEESEPGRTCDNFELDLYGLTDEEKEILTLNIVNRESFEDIAKILGKDLFYVKTRFEDAVEKLRPRKAE